MKIKACLRSGFCCSKAPCPFGEVTSDQNPSCLFLERQPDGRTLCGKYDEIQRDPTIQFSPAFGSGCCMPLFNEDRERIKHKHHQGQEIYVKNT